MDNRQHRIGPFGAYAVLGTASAAASACIVLSAVSKLTQITDNAMFCIAAMTFSPAVMAAVVAYFIHRTASK